MERQRKVILTATGNQRMRMAMESHLPSDERTRFTGAEISRYVSTKGCNLHSGTINKILNNRGVDPGSLRDLFSAFGLTLEESDYQYPVQDSNPPPRVEDSEASKETVPTNIPFLGTTTFVGRSQTLEELHELLNRETLR